MSYIYIILAAPANFRKAFFLIISAKNNYY